MGEGGILKHTLGSFFRSSHVIFKSQPAWKMLNLFVGKVNTAKVHKFLP